MTGSDKNAMTHHPIVGRWVSDPADTKSIEKHGRVTVDFRPGGVLEYTIHVAGKRQIIWLTYRIEGHCVITDQPSNPRPERTDFSIDNDRLYLRFGGDLGRFVRVPAEWKPED
jgi:hypothetical protein